MPGKYQVALVLGRDRYVNLAHAKHLFNDKRAFVVYKWDPLISYEDIVHTIEPNESGRDVRVRRVKQEVLGGWYSWLHFSGTKWRIVGKHSSIGKDKKNMMLQAHMFWETEKEFTNWIGKDNYSQLFVDLL